jgi:hypothetical protein
MGSTKMCPGKHILYGQRVLVKGKKQDTVLLYCPQYGPIADLMASLKHMFLPQLTLCAFEC